MPAEADKPNVIRQLLAVCPELEPLWREHRTDDDEEPLLYMQASALAQAAVEAKQAGDASFMKPLFDEVERLLAIGTAEERELLVVGFLEDLQGAVGWAKLSPDPFYGLLGDQSRIAWDELMATWDEIARKKANGELPPGAPMPDVSDPALKNIVQGIYRPPRGGH